ncbi:MAG: energy transducer TonB [Pseudomonadota bacterium]
MEEIPVSPPIEPPKEEPPPPVEQPPPEPVPVVPPVLTSEAPSDVPATFDVAPAVEEPPPAPPPPPVAVRAPPKVEIEHYVPPDVNAAYRNNPLPPYPLVAKRRGLEGVVVLAVSLNINGRPVHVAVKRSSGHGSLDETAVQSVRSWQFEPARRGGQAVAAEVEVPLRFALK